MPTVSFEDFYQVPDLKFDITRLKNDLDKILKNKKFKSDRLNLKDENFILIMCEINKFAHIYTLITLM